MVLSLRTPLTLALTRATAAAALCLVTAPGIAQPSPKDILAFGDSITRGWPYWQHNLNGGQGGAYPTELDRLIRSESPEENVTIRNWAVGGENSYEALSRYEGVLAASRPDYALIMIGTNDLFDGISPYSTAANIRVMIDRTRAYGAKPIVANLTPSYYPGHRGDRIGSLYNPLIEREVELAEATLNDAYAAFQPNWSNLTSDGLHPNIAGYALLARTWCDLLEVCAKRDDGSMSVIYDLLLLSDDTPPGGVADPNGNAPL